MDTSSPSSSIEINDQFKKCLDLLEKTSKNLFITGKAGTGKSTLLEYFRHQTIKNVAVLAPTGVAAVNVKGQTIHSFFQFRPNVTPELVQKVRMNAGIYKELDVIVIDEISMVRADLLDCIDKFLRLNGPDKYQPFGGVQMVFFGDLYQLPPVVTEADKAVLGEIYASPYFFDANVFACFTMEVIQLNKIYRQTDDAFIDILNGVRTNKATYDHLATLNRQFNPHFLETDDDFFICLTATNALADTVNERHLNRLIGETKTYEATISGDFAPKDAPTSPDLAIKAGAQVMLLNNDTSKRWVNGSIGKIVKIRKEDGEPDCIVVELSSGTTVDVFPHSWEAHHFVVDGETKRVEMETVGSFTQYPLKLAWAVTIHKSQGKTFDKVVIDIGRGTFAHGQMYVALSRCRSLEGIILKQLIHKRNIILDKRVDAFMNQFLTTSIHRGEQAVDAPQRFAF